MALSSLYPLLLWSTSMTIMVTTSSCVLWCNLIVSIDAFTHPTSQSVMASRTTFSITKTYSTKDNADEEQPKVVERVRAAVFQAPLLQSENPLEILTEVADSLRVASLHGVDVVIYPELYLSGNGRPNNNKALDRESYELNIVGNMCGELNVACIIGYAEAVHESELKKKSDDSNDSITYNSLAAFHADGSRAGNYRSVSASRIGGTEFRKGSPFVEFIPTTLKLPNRETSEQSSERAIKVGMMCGNDILSPEHSRHLVRCGTQVLFASCSFQNNNSDRRALAHVILTRAIENSVPVVFANKESATTTDSKDANDFIGSSAIISQDGEYLVCGPEEYGGDMPSDGGYLIPCKAGAIYAADIDIDTGNVSTVIQQSIDHWDLNPLIPDAIGEKGSKETKRESNGFGNQSGKQSKGKKLRK